MRPALLLALVLLPAAPALAQGTPSQEERSELGIEAELGFWGLTYNRGELWRSFSLGVGLTHGRHSVSARLLFADDQGFSLISISIGPPLPAQQVMEQGLLYGYSVLDGERASLRLGIGLARVTERYRPDPDEARNFTYRAGVGVPAEVVVALHPAKWFGAFVRLNGTLSAEGVYGGYTVGITL